MTRAGDEIIKKLEDATLDAAGHQSETLRYILQHNGGVSYLQRYLGSYDEPVDAETFRRAVPLSRYEDYADYINKMADGVLSDENDGGRPLLSVDPLICFFYRLFPPRPSVNKVLWFYYAGNVTKTKGGYKAMAATSSPLHNDPKGSNSSRLLSVCISPKEVILGTDVEQQMYCHLLCGLRNCDQIDSIRAPYASGLARAFRLLESKWEQLCEDLENGYPAAEITDSAMRASFAEVLSGPRPNLSNKFRLILQEKDWGGIVSKLWPNVRYVKCITTGSMMQYYEKLRYYAGDVPLLGGDYFSSECSIALNFDLMQPPEQTRYTMIPSAAYFEFLPFDMDRSCCSSGSHTLDLSSVEVGKFYELIVTTYRGLYRYRLGDIVKVVGHYNSSPQVEFVMRAPKTSGDIITERDLMSAMGGFQVVVRDVMSAEVTDFTSSFHLEAEPHQLKIFLEFKDGCGLLQKEQSELEMKLRKCYCRLEDDLGGIYKVMKARGEVSSLLLLIVKPGSFDCLLQVAVERGAPATQYKPPKMLRDHKLVEFMEMSAILTLTADSFQFKS